MANLKVFHHFAGCIVLAVEVTLAVFSYTLHAQQSSKIQPSQDGISDTKWQLETYFQGGTLPPSYHYFFSSPQYLNTALDFYSAAFVVGRKFHQTSFPLKLSGRGEALLEVIPYWQAHYPNQKISVLVGGLPQANSLPFTITGINRFGSSVTPFLMRWNFMHQRNQVVVPWIQLGGGLLWTNHKFPVNFYPIPPGNAGTSVINFTPQVGAGVNFFHRPRQSADLAIKFIHISNAGLGDNNPGIDYTIQFAAGYSWWK